MYNANITLEKRSLEITIRRTNEETLRITIEKNYQRNTKRTIY